MELTVRHGLSLPSGTVILSCGQNDNIRLNEGVLKSCRKKSVFEKKSKPVAEPACPELVFRANIPLDVFQRDIGRRVEAGSVFVRGVNILRLLIFLQTLPDPWLDKFKKKPNRNDKMILANQVFITGLSERCEGSL